MAINADVTLTSDEYRRIIEEQRLKIAGLVEDNKAKDKRISELTCYNKEFSEKCEQLNSIIRANDAIERQQCIIESLEGRSAANRRAKERIEEKMHDFVAQLRIIDKETLSSRDIFDVFYKRFKDREYSPWEMVAFEFHEFVEAIAMGRQAHEEKIKSLEAELAVANKEGNTDAQ